jgi:hypothetical protein
MTEPLIKSLNKVAHLEPTSSFGTPNEDSQSYHVDCFLDGIVGITSLGPILVSLVRSLGDLSLERVLPV